MKAFVSTVCLTAIYFATFAQNAPKPADIAAIKAQCGCHDVDFVYAETFSPDKAYQFKERYRAKGTELVFVDEERPGKIVIQHLLVMGDSASGKTMVIKHWREDWLFENKSLLAFNQNASWKRVTKSPADVRGQWTQQVFEVDDSPRYEASATWIHTDGKTYWESTVDAPLPRREYTKRSDYNVMRRTNRHRITPDGYIHEQDNDKIIRSEAGDQLLAQEKGLNTYRRIDDKKCEAGREWWAKHRAYWVDVRNTWNEVLASRTDVALRGQVKGMVLSRELEDLGKTALASPYDAKTTRPLIRQTIEKYLK